VAQLNASRRREGNAIHAALQGIADVDETTLLERFLEEIHAEAVDNAAALVRVDLNKLEFMSATCMKRLLVWFSQVMELERPYSIRFRPDPKIPWQRRSLEALRCFATEIVGVDTP